MDYAASCVSSLFLCGFCGHSRTPRKNVPLDQPLRGRGCAKPLFGVGSLACDVCFVRRRSDQLLCRKAERDDDSNHFLLRWGPLSEGRLAVWVYSRAFCLRLHSLLKPFKPLPPMSEIRNFTRQESPFISQRFAQMWTWS